VIAFEFVYGQTQDAPWLSCHYIEKDGVVFAVADTASVAIRQAGNLLKGCVQFLDFFYCMVVRLLVVALAEWSGLEDWFKLEWIIVHGASLYSLELPAL
jgi:hypothetical protein